MLDHSFHVPAGCDIEVPQGQGRVHMHLLLYARAVKGWHHCHMIMYRVFLKAREVRTWVMVGGGGVRMYVGL